MARWKILVSLLFVIVLAIVWAVASSQQRLRIRVETDGDKVVLIADGQRHEMTWDERPTRVRFMRLGATEREYQIDGSDTTTNGTYNGEYFSTFQKSLYYRFQSWLRDEDAYNRWQNIVIIDDVAGDVSYTDVITPSIWLKLPTRYTLKADLYRPEKWGAMLFMNEQNNGYIVVFQRDARKFQVAHWVKDSEKDVPGNWYFPLEPAPFASELLDTFGHVLFWALALLALALALGGILTVIPIADGVRRLVASLGVRLTSRHLAIVALAIMGLSFGAVTWITLVKYNGLPHIFDSMAMYMQAKLFASGRLFTGPPPNTSLFDYPFMVNYQGRYFAQYPPGTSATIALFMLLSPKLGWLAGPLLSVLTLGGIFVIARMLYGNAVALLSLILAALSPFYNFMAGSMMSHPYSLFYLTFFLLFLLRYHRSGRRRDVAISGAFLGAAFITRESATAFFAAPWLLIIWGNALWRRKWKAIPDLLVFALCAGLVTSLYLLYNAQTTGNPFKNARAQLDPNDRYGFGDKIGWNGKHTVAAGLAITDEQVTSLLIHLFGWPFYLTLAPALIPFVSGRFKRWDVANALGALAFVLGFTAYFFHSIVYGPRYYYEALPFFVMLTARGFQAAGEVVGDLWTRLRGENGNKALAAVYIILALLVACNLLYYTPRQLQQYTGFAGGAKKPDLTTIYGTRFSNAVVMTDDMFLYRDVMAPLNCPDALACDPVYILVRNDADLATAKNLFPDRVFYKLQDPYKNARFEQVP